MQQYQKIFVEYDLKEELNELNYSNLLKPICTLSFYYSTYYFYKPSSIFMTVFFDTEWEEC